MNELLTVANIHSVIGGLNRPWKMSLSDISHPPAPGS